MSLASVFSSAIRGPDKEVDAGYLAIAWALAGWGINNGVILALAWIALKHLPAASDPAALIQNTGIALGANATGFAAVCGAVGLFRAGDEHKS